MENNSNTTSHHICGFWFHVTWNNEDFGTDQHGCTWVNKSKPQLRNEVVLNTCLTNYVNIKKSTLCQ